MNRPWELPAGAWLDPRWNTAMDLASVVPVSRVKVAAAWADLGPDRTLAALRAMAAAGEARQDRSDGDGRVMR